MDLYSVLEIPIFEALLGGEFIVPTFWGKVELKIPELTRDGEKFKIKGKGVKKNGRQGDHIVQIKHKMPRKITSSVRRKLEDLI
jgi:DnaJ-class molecular chaperone